MSAMFVCPLFPLSFFFSPSQFNFISHSKLSIYCWQLNVECSAAPLFSPFNRPLNYLQSILQYQKLIEYHRYIQSPLGSLYRYRIKFSAQFIMHNIFRSLTHTNCSITVLMNQMNEWMNLPILSISLLSSVVRGWMELTYHLLNTNWLWTLTTWKLTFLFLFCRLFIQNEDTHENWLLWTS